MTKEISKWSDSFMFEAEEIDSAKGPEVYLLSANNDPLGSIAAAAKAYKGEFVKSLAEITDEERKYYLGEIQKTKLEMPLESVNFQFRITGVTRGFTHQLVRQRTAAYSQESTRFAVKSGVPVGLPPSLIGTNPDAWDDNLGEALEMGFSAQGVEDYAYKHTSQRDRWRMKWDRMMGYVAEGYNELVNDGMPAEDARGALPTNLLTQVNYHTNLRGLKDHAGNRLCTQAQFEWRLVWHAIIVAIQEYGNNQTYSRTIPGNFQEHGIHAKWQFDALAAIFRPVCYYTGKCEFKADFDRKCTIRDRVDKFHEHGVPSTQWDKDFIKPVDSDPVFVKVDGMMPKPDMRTIRFEGINPREWLLDPGAAR